MNTKMLASTQTGLRLSSSEYFLIAVWSWSISYTGASWSSGWSRVPASEPWSSSSKYCCRTLQWLTIATAWEIIFFADSSLLWMDAACYPCTRPLVQNHDPYTGSHEEFNSSTCEVCKKHMIWVNLILDFSGMIQYSIVYETELLPHSLVPNLLLGWCPH